MIPKKDELKWNLITSYLDIFKNGDNPSAIIPLVSADLKFQGPLLATETAAEYVSHLNAEGRAKMSIAVHQRYSSPFSFCVVYTVEKEENPLWVCQIFEFKEDKISKIQTIFDRQSLQG